MGANIAPCPDSAPVTDQQNTTSPAPCSPANQITIRVKGIRALGSQVFTRKKGGCKNVILHTLHTKNDRWLNAGVLMPVFFDDAVGLYNPKTGVYFNMKEFRYLDIDDTPFKDISEEDLSWQAVYNDIDDSKLLFFAWYLLLAYKPGLGSIKPILLLRDIEKGRYLPTWWSKFRSKWKTFIEEPNE